MIRDPVVIRSGLREPDDMRARLALPCGLLLAWLVVSFLPAGETPVVKVGEAVADFTLKDAGGQPWSLRGLKEPTAIVVVFLSFECPVSTDYCQPLADLHAAYAAKGVAFIGVCPRDEGDAATLAKKAKEYRLPFPVLCDDGLKATQALGAKATPEAFVLDGKRVLRYRGRIDDAYTARLKKNPRISREDLKLALEAVIAGKEVAIGETEAVGCPIGLPEAKASGKVEYHRDIVPILQKHCQECHRPGGVGPFSLLTYRQARTWAEDLKGYTKDRRMPPWKPVDGPGFRGERRLSDAEVATLAAWVDGGTVEGDPKTAPKPREFVDGWQLGKPDLVLTMPEFELAATGGDHFRAFVLPTELTEDKHVTAIEVHPGNPRIVHHAVILLDPGQRGRKQQEAQKVRDERRKPADRGAGYESAMALELLPSTLLGPWPLIGVWTPGQVPGHLPEGTGYFVPKGSDLILQIHYHRSGRVEKDRTSIGLYFAKKPEVRRVEGFSFPGRMLFVPAGSERFKVYGHAYAPQDMVLHSAFPHMHLIGKEMKVTMTLPDGGATTTLIHIKDWDFNWQETYFFQKPIMVPMGTRFDLEAVYDNSAKNPANPFNPPRTIFTGLETTDEMCAILFDATSDRQGRIWPLPFQLKREK
jgi:peroxiredoxin